MLRQHELADKFYYKHCFAVNILGYKKKQTWIRLTDKIKPNFIQNLLKFLLSVIKQNFPADDRSAVSTLKVTPIIWHVFKT